MEGNSPKYLNCAWCSAQATLAKTQTRHALLRYVCPAKHVTFVLEEDPSFNHGYLEEHIVMARIT
jgi:hypothetical protein